MTTRTRAPSRMRGARRRCQTSPIRADSRTLAPVRRGPGAIAIHVPDVDVLSRQPARSHAGRGMGLAEMPLEILGPVVERTDVVREGNKGAVAARVYPQLV